MSVRLRDRIAGALLLAAALVWVGLVYATIPPGQEATAGARAFPLWLGLALAALALMLLAQTFAGAGAADEPGGDGPVSGVEAWSVAAAIGLTILYGMVMERLGFLVATVLFVAAALTVLLRIRRPIFVAAMSFGISIGAYVLFQKVLGTYLPPGTWISVYF